VTARSCAGTSLRIWEVMSALNRIATGEELTTEQAGEYFSNPQSLVEVFRSSGALKDPQKAAAIDRLSNDDYASFRDSAA
jgi:hypothetical protein